MFARPKGSPPRCRDTSGSSTLTRDESTDGVGIDGNLPGGEHPRLELIGLAWPISPSSDWPTLAMRQDELSSSSRA